MAVIITALLTRDLVFSLLPLTTKKNGGGGKFQAINRFFFLESERKGVCVCVRVCVCVCVCVVIVVVSGHM